MNEEDLFSLLGFVKVSRLRTETLKALGSGTKMPSEISRQTRIRTSQVSGSLGELKRKDMVVCINEDANKGRLYRCTPLGLEVLKKLELD